jgi:hypothetical protein
MSISRSISRRQALLATLFGAGGVGIRALATGLPASFFLNPRKAMAGGACPVDAGAAKAQYVIFSTSGQGDPINANCPGTYGNIPAPNMNIGPIIHAPQTGGSTDAGGGTNMAPTAFSLNGKMVTAAYPWSTLPQSALKNTLFFHMATNTPIHPQEPQVLELGPGAGEMLPSLIAKAVAGPLRTIQPKPVCLGALTPAEALLYDGAPQPIIPPLALADTLTNPTSGGLAVLTNLQKIRDATMTDIYNIYYKSGTPTQQAYIDNLANAQSDARKLSQTLLSQLGSLATTYKGDAVKQQIQAAIILIQMNVAPVISIHIPFGGDNHADAGLATEATETNSGVAYINFLLQQLAGVNDVAGDPLTEKVSFMTLNVFGRTLGKTAPSPGDGRAHNPNHHVSVCIGAPFKGGVIGGVGQVTNQESPGGDYGALSIDPSTGQGIPGDGGSGIVLQDTLGSFGMTMLQAVGGCASDVLQNSQTNPMGTAAVVTGALVSP